MRRNLYDLLGVRPDDDAGNVRRAFLRAAKASHPDHHGGDPEAAARFRQISEAYDVLRDAEQRAAYDRRLEAERRPLRFKLKSAFSDVRSHIVTDAVIGVMFAIMLAGGYKLYSRMTEPVAVEGVQMTAHGPAGRAAVQPAPQTSASEPDRPAAAPAPVMPIAPPAMVGDASPVQTIDTARGETVRPDLSSVVAGGQIGAKAGSGVRARNRSGWLLDQPDVPPAGIDVPDGRVPDARSSDIRLPDLQVPEIVLAAKARRDDPGPSSTGAAPSADRPDGRTPETDGASPAPQGNRPKRHRLKRWCPHGCMRR